MITSRDPSRSRNVLLRLSIHLKIGQYSESNITPVSRVSSIYNSCYDVCGRRERESSRGKGRRRIELVLSRTRCSVETNGSGGRLRSLRRSTNYSLCLFAFYATALANDISRSARSLPYHHGSIILYGCASDLENILAGKRVGRGKGRVGFEDETIVWKSVSRYSAIITAREENALRRGMKHRVMRQSWLAWDGNNFTFDHK